ncbi:hypothetical protein GQR58_026717 [Nymphon striatum]|nr:hypothetical protein GQR58_026717 [Nymphon striatum]
MTLNRENLNQNGCPLAETVKFIIEPPVNHNPKIDLRHGNFGTWTSATNTHKSRQLFTQSVGKAGHGGTVKSVRSRFNFPGGSTLNISARMSCDEERPCKRRKSSDKSNIKKIEAAISSNDVTKVEELLNLLIQPDGLVKRRHMGRLLWYSIKSKSRPAIRIILNFFPNHHRPSDSLSDDPGDSLSDDPGDSLSDDPDDFAWILNIVVGMTHGPKRLTIPMLNILLKEIRGSDFSWYFPSEDMVNIIKFLHECGLKMDFNSVEFTLDALRTAHEDNLDGIMNVKCLEDLFRNPLSLKSLGRIAVRNAIIRTKQFISLEERVNTLNIPTYCWCGQTCGNRHSTLSFSTSPQLTQHRDLLKDSLRSSKSGRDRRPSLKQEDEKKGHKIGTVYTVKKIRSGDNEPYGIDFRNLLTSKSLGRIAVRNAIIRTKQLVSLEERESTLKSLGRIAVRNAIIRTKQFISLEERLRFSWGKNPHTPSFDFILELSDFSAEDYLTEPEESV